MPEEYQAGEAGAATSGKTPSPKINRRQFLRGAAGGIGALTLAACGDVAIAATPKKPFHYPWTTGAPLPPAVTDTVLASGARIRQARWLLDENSLPGTIDWIVGGVQTAHTLEGFASHVSAVPGEDVALFVNTQARAVQVQAYRMGYYQGLGSRLVYISDFVAAGQQPPATVAPGVNIVSCPWSPTTSVSINKSWPPGCYLLKLVGDGGQQQYIPLTIRDDASNATYVLQNSVTTWQAYNQWGGYSLYYGKTANGGKNFANRARAVSFDRPYPKDWAEGAADFVGNELPLLFHLESLGADLTYWTDIDLHAQPTLLKNHQCLFSMGHDEYWSAPMKDGAAAALSSGTNLAFLGANACYRQIRLEATSVGPNRLEVCYKNASEDPMSKTSPTLTTVDWNQSPVAQPESRLIGATYQSVNAKDDIVVSDASSWFLKGTGLSAGERLPQSIVGEYDRYVPSANSPDNVDVIAHSPISAQHNYSDITYYSAGSGAGGVLATGNAHFVYLLSNTTAFPENVVPAAVPGVTEVLLRAMENVYDAFGHGPASVAYPSSGTGNEVYAGHSVGIPASTNSA